jgi:hypothetical protein
MPLFLLMNVCGVGVGVGVVWCGVLFAGKRGRTGAPSAPSAPPSSSASRGRSCSGSGSGRGRGGGSGSVFHDAVALSTVADNARCEVCKCVGSADQMLACTFPACSRAYHPVRVYLSAYLLL